MGRFLGCHRASELVGGHEILLSAFDREQVGNDLSRYHESGAVGITISSLCRIVNRHVEHVGILVSPLESVVEIETKLCRDWMSLR